MNKNSNSKNQGYARIRTPCVPGFKVKIKKLRTRLRISSVSSCTRVRTLGVPDFKVKIKKLCTRIRTISIIVHKNSIIFEIFMYPVRTRF